MYTWIFNLKKVRFWECFWYPFSIVLLLDLRDYRQHIIHNINTHREEIHGYILYRFNVSQSQSIKMFFFRNCHFPHSRMKCKNNNSEICMEDRKIFDNFVRNRLKFRRRRNGIFEHNFGIGTGELYRDEHLIFSLLNETL